MDKDPIREEAEKEVNAKFVKHPMEVDELGRVVDAQSEEKSICNCEIDRCRYIAKQMIEKHLRDKAELLERANRWMKLAENEDDVTQSLREKLTALRSHNLELVEALKEISSMTEICHEPSKDYFLEVKRVLKPTRGALLAKKALSSPPSEKYLKMVEPLKEEVILDILTRRKEIHRTMISIGMKDTTTAEMEEIVRKELAKTIYTAQFDEALKSYNSEKGGEVNDK